MQRISGQHYPKEYTILKHGLFVQNFVISLYANEKMVLELFYHSFRLSCSIHAWLQGKGNLQLKTKWMIFDTYSSFIYDEWAVSSLRHVIGVHHVPCFISDLNSSHDLPKLNSEFPVGVSLTKYPVSTTTNYQLKDQPKHHV